MNNNETVNNNASIADILKHRVLTEPEKVIYVVEVNGTGEITYSELYKCVLATSSILYREVDKATCLLMYESPFEFLTGFLACNIIGITAVPLTIPKSFEDIEKWEKVAADSGAAGILTEQKHYLQLCRRTKASEKLKNLKHFVNQNIITDEIKYMNNNEPIALLQYTSGSTGDPKGVILSNAILLESMKKNALRYKITENSVIVNWLPFHHVLGSIFGLLQGIYSNCKTIVMSPEEFVREPLSWIRNISNFHATHTGAPNFAFDYAAEELKRMNHKELSLESLEVIYCAGEPVSLATMQRFITEAKKIGLRENKLFPAYGLTETAQFLSAYTVGQTPGWLELNRQALQDGRIEISGSGRLGYDKIEAKDNSIYVAGVGYITEDDKIAVETAGNCLVNRTNTIGEIVISGPTVTEGYWKKEYIRNESFRQDEWQNEYLKTGDIGFFTETGEIFLTGRSKDLIIVRGVNYIPQDIEKTIESLEERFLKNSAAAFLSEADENALIIIQEVKGKIINQEADSWAAKVRAKILETYSLVAADILFVPEKDIPRTQSGKIQRKKTKEEYLKGKWKEKTYYNSNGNNTLSCRQEEDQSLNTIKKQIKRMIARQLNIEAEDVDEDIPFMEMGIHSIMFLELRNEISGNLETEISTAELFSHNTVKSMAEFIYRQINDTVNNAEIAEKSVGGREELEDCSDEELLTLLEDVLEEMQDEI